MRSCRISLVPLVLLAFGCASSTGVTPPLDTEIQIEQLPASEFVVENRGAISIAYQMTVRNRSAQPITLRQLKLQTIGRSPYLLRNAPLPFNETIEPGGAGMVTFSMWAYPREGAKPTEKVWIRGTADFEAASGSFQRVFTQSFREP